MSQYSFVGIWSISKNGMNYLQPMGSNHALSMWGPGKANDPANCYNVYSTPTPDAFIFQSQLNGMYIGVPAGQSVVCAGIPEAANAQPLIPHWDESYTIVFYLPDKLRFMAAINDGKNYVWQKGAYFGDPINIIDGGFEGPSEWSFSDLLKGKGTGGRTLHYVNLTDHYFESGANFTDINFSDAILDGATFDESDLTRAHFINSSLKKATFRKSNLTHTDFTNSNLQGATLDLNKLPNTDFTNCRLQHSWLRGTICVETIFNKANLTGAKLKGVTWTNVKAIGAILSEADFVPRSVLTNSDLTGATLDRTIFSDATFEQVIFTNCDLTSVEAYNVTNVSTQSKPLIFNNAKLNFSLINHDWQWMDLRNAAVKDLPKRLSSSSTSLQATGAKLSGLNQNSLQGVILEHAVLDYALMDNLDLSGSHLSNASLINAGLHGAVLSNASLVDAKLTGAQLGTLSRLFTLPSSTESALNTGQVATISPEFSQNGITLSSTATLNTLSANRVWQLNDAGNHITYTIRLETQSDSTEALVVYKPATPASLAGAYMPNAVLTGANLYGITANNIQFYGSNARLDGSAILEDAKLNGSNLSTVNFTQARLMGTNLSNSHLFNANFRGAHLTPSPSGAADLSYCNLQGADFTDAALYGANLTNAAVAIKVPIQGNPNQGGVYLFSLPYKGDTHTEQQYIAELNGAATRFSLNPEGDAATLKKYVNALETKNLNLLKIPFLEQHPPIHLSSSAEIQTITPGSVWQIVDGNASYSLWTDVDENVNIELYAAPSLTNTQAAFQHYDINLRWQASVSIDTAGSQWLIDNDSENPQNTSTGYMSFLLKLDGGVLDVYGTAIRIIRLGDGNQQEYHTETCNVTILGQTNMDAKTICPNGTTLSVNQSDSGETWDEKWLRASTPPAPPTCVPTPYTWCSPTQTKTTGGFIPSLTSEEH